MREEDRVFLRRLHSLISRHFSLEELQTLCFYLGLNFEDLQGEGLNAKVRELIMLMSRRERLDALLEEAKRTRPFVKWPDFPAGFVLSGGNIFSDTDAVRQAPTFNIGTIHSGQTNFGDMHIDNLNIDVSERTLFESRDIVISDKIETSASLHDTAKSMEGWIESANRAIQTAVSEADKTKLINLVNELGEQLNSIYGKHPQAATSVAKRIEALAQEVSVQAPDKQEIQSIGLRLENAAQSLVDVLPTVIQVTNKIVAAALTFAK